MHTTNLRVAMLIQRYYPHIGGAERQLQHLVRLLKMRGVESVILTRHFGKLPWFEVIDGIPVYRLPAPGPKPVASLIYTLSCLVLLFRIRPHIVHAHEILSPATVAVWSHRLYKNATVVKILGGGGRGDIAKLKKRPFGKFRIKALRENIDIFLAISREIRDELEEIGITGKRQIYLPNGVDTKAYAPVGDLERSLLRRTLGIPENAIVAIFVGRLILEKGVEQLLNAWREVLNEIPGAYLLILGDGPEKIKLQSMATASVLFLGFVEDSRTYLQASDLFVLPSFYEGLSNAMLEAMSVGLPVLATNVGGMPDVVIDNQSGYLIPPGDTNSLKVGLLTLLKDPELRSKFGHNARLRIEADYSIDNTADRLLALYNRLMSEQST